jgi:hypothetical protein
MITVWNARKGQTRVSPLARPGGEKPVHSGKMICWQGYSVNHQLLTPGCNLKRILFLTDQSRNVIENKGPLCKAWRRSRNVYENTGT